MHSLVSLQILDLDLFTKFTKLKWKLKKLNFFKFHLKNGASRLDDKVE